MKREERSGLLFALAGFVLLSVGDGVIKSMAGLWSPAAMAALRFTFGLSGLAALVALREGRAGFRMPMKRWQVLRGVAIAVSSALFFTALGLMPIGDATAIGFVSPMFATLLAVPLLGEPMRARNWLAIVIAFAGVLIVLRPNLAALGPAALLPVAAAVTMALLFIGNRRTAGSASPLAMQLYMAMVAVPCLMLFAVLGHLSGIARLAVGFPDWTVVLRCAVVAVIASTGHYLIFQGTVRAGAGHVAPMTYVQLLVAMAIGWAVFGEAPDLPALAGAAIIAVAGLILLGAGGRGRELVSDLADRDG